MQIDAELLALLVEVAALEAEGAGNVGHVEIVAANFGEEDFAFEGFGAFDESSLPRWRRWRRLRADGRFAGGQDQADIFVA